MTTSPLSLHGTPRTAPTAITTTSLCSRKPITFSDGPKILQKSADVDATRSAAWETPYPKILQDGAVESFRPQEVHEKVTYAEPLSPPNEQEAFAQTASGVKEGEEDRTSVDETPEETSVSCPFFSYQVESGLNGEPPFNDEVTNHQITTVNLSPYQVVMTEKPCIFSLESEKDAPFEDPAEKEEMQQPHAPIDAWEEKECIGTAVEEVQEETSDSETQAVLEPTFESRTSSPMSDCEHAEGVFNQLTDFSQDENSSKDDAVDLRQEISCSVVGTNETDVEDKLYPDGEEMDTWDSVIERKVDLKTNDDITEGEAKRQHAEPEEDISAREPAHVHVEVDEKASSVMETQVDNAGQRVALYQENASPPDKEDDDEEEDSQNVCVSWRTELECDSYAQDNTLADTRPLIRYKSDDTDANTQASHIEESESSEGEQEKKIGETGSGTWCEGKSKRFGTMEDLCEEVEGGVLDEEYELGYTHTEDRDVGPSENAMSVYDTDHSEEMLKKVTEGYLDEETEELTKPRGSANLDYEEELEIDLVGHGLGGGC